MRKLITIIISRGEKQFVAECREINVVTQGKTIDEVITNLKKALALYLEDENVDELF